MAERIVIVGAGYSGLRLAESAVGDGYEVVGTTRSEETLETLESMGAEAVYWEADDGDDEPIVEVVEPGTAVVYSVPTLFRDYESEFDEVARHVRPVQRVLETSAHAGAERFIYLSSTSVYGDQDGAWVDETSRTDPSSPAGKMRRDIETYVLEGADDHSMARNVARLVGIYGPGRTLLDYMESGRYRLVDGGRKPSNRIHVDDIVGALEAMIERGPEGARLYNVSDGSPKTVADVVDWLVEHCDAERPEEVSLETYADMRGPNAAARWSNTYRVANDRLVEELDVDLQYEDVFAGYRAIFDLE